MDDASAGRANQRRRTRKDLLEAASRLMKQGRKPSLEEIAEAALVSRATAYRYFPSVEALILEASVDIAVPAPEVLFGPDAPRGAMERLTLVDAALHDMIAANEPALRMVLAQALERSLQGGEGAAPVRQNRRSPLIEAALDPVRGEFDPAVLPLLAKALAIVSGTEAMVVCKDVLQLDEDEARRVRLWAIAALVQAARKA